MIKIPGLEQMDPASRQSALIAALVGEVESLEKQVLGLEQQVVAVSNHNLTLSELLSAHESRLLSLEALENQKQAIAKVQIDARPEVKVDAKGLVANLISVFQWLKRKK